MASIESLKPVVPLLAGFTLGAGVMILEEKYPRVRLKTHPELPAGFKVADNTLEFAAMRFLDVYSHHWHWNNIPYDKRFAKHGVYLKGAPSGNPHNNPFFGVIAHLGGRPYGHIIEAENSAQGYYIGFLVRDEIRRCSIELTGPVMLLSGPDEGCVAYAMDKNGNPLGVNILSDLIHKSNKPRGIRIL